MQQCSSERCAVCGALRMRLGCFTVQQQQCGCARLEIDECGQLRRRISVDKQYYWSHRCWRLRFCGKANAYAQHHKFRMGGSSTCPIGQATLWRPLSEHLLVFCSKDKNGGLLVCYRPLRSNSFAKLGLSCAVDAHCHGLSTAHGSRSVPRSLFSSRCETAPHSAR